MGQKRGVIERFINEELCDIIDAEMNSGAILQDDVITKQLAELTAQIRANLADDAIDVEGTLADAHAKTKLGKQYLALRAEASGAQPAQNREATIYNHLYHFFKRYYDKGDFMSLRRYSKNQKYAIPYNGEEVYLHWANADQYYKTKSSTSIL